MVKSRKSLFLFTAQFLRKTNLTEIFSEPDLERSLTKTIYEFGRHHGLM